MIKIQCPQCGRESQIPEKYAGKRGRCNGCGATLVVPESLCRQTASHPENESVVSFVCPQCGPTLQISSADGIISCKSCGNAYVIRKGIPVPLVDRVSYIPFTVDAEARDRILLEWLVWGEYTPTDILRSSLLLSSIPVFVPFYVFSVKYSATWTAQRGTNRTEIVVVDEEYWDTEPYAELETVYESEPMIRMEIGGRTERSIQSVPKHRTVTKHRNVKKLRRVSREIQHTDYSPASGKIEGDSLIDSLACTDLTDSLHRLCSEATRDEYSSQDAGVGTFTGALLQPVAFSPEKCWGDEIEDELNETIEDNCREDVTGDTYKDLRVRPDIQRQSTTMVYVPFWVIEYEYQNQKFSCVIEGQDSRQIEGNRPVDTERSERAKEWNAQIAILDKRLARPNYIFFLSLVPLALWITFSHNIPYRIAAVGFVVLSITTLTAALVSLRDKKSLRVARESISDLIQTQSQISTDVRERELKAFLETGTALTPKELVGNASDNSTITTSCPHCKYAMIIPRKYAGMQGKCTRCGGILTVPHDSAQMGTPPRTPVIPDMSVMSMVLYALTITSFLVCTVGLCFGLVFIPRQADRGSALAAPAPQSIASGGIYLVTGRIRSNPTDMRPEVIFEKNCYMLITDEMPDKKSPEFCTARKSMGAIWGPSVYVRKDDIRQHAVWAR